MRLRRVGRIARYTAFFIGLSTVIAICAARPGDHPRWAVMVAPGNENERIIKMILVERRVGEFCEIDEILKSSCRKGSIL